MRALHKGFNERDMLHYLKIFLPIQAPLNNSVQHNALHAFQDKSFFEALSEASQIFGYQVFLPLSEFRKRYSEGTISRGILERTIVSQKGKAALTEWLDKMLVSQYDALQQGRIGQLRAKWQDMYAIDLDKQVHPKLVRILDTYNNNDADEQDFLSWARSSGYNNLSEFFSTNRPKQLLKDCATTIVTLLALLVGDENCYEAYLFDQQFAQKQFNYEGISLHDRIFFELLLEIDALDKKLGTTWVPLAVSLKDKPAQLFGPVQKNELFDVLQLWQTALEWTFYDEVLAGLTHQKNINNNTEEADFQSFFYNQLPQKLFPANCLFFNLFEYSTDLQGDYLLRMLKTLAPQAGSIAPKYFFKGNNCIQDNVAKNANGDEHNPIRKLVIVEHYPDIIIKQIAKDAALYEWYKNQWVRLVAIHPQTKELFILDEGVFVAYTPLLQKIYTLKEVELLADSAWEDVPLYLLN